MTDLRDHSCGSDCRVAYQSKSQWIDPKFLHSSIKVFLGKIHTHTHTLKNECLQMLDENIVWMCVWLTDDICRRKCFECSICKTGTRTNTQKSKMQHTRITMKTLAKKDCKTNSLLENPWIKKQKSEITPTEEIKLTIRKMRLKSESRIVLSE